MSGSQEQPLKGESDKNNIQDGLDRSDHELKLLANFYHQHGFKEQAQEIYRTILNIRGARNARERKADS
jgi:hypothetical protein